MAASLPHLRIALWAGVALAAAFAGPACAQTMSSNSASYNSGWGRSPDQENQGANAQMRDANGNLLVVDGVIMNSTNQNLFSGGGVSTSGSGAFASGATAIGNSLSVVTQGNDNTVIIDSRQTNNGVVTATSTTSGVGGNGS
ncbi:MAG TPA: holdfast anchoring protein HfaA [Caulobacteraceae bacterium]